MLLSGGVLIGFDCRFNGISRQRIILVNDQLLSLDHTYLKKLELMSTMNDPVVSVLKTF